MTCFKNHYKHIIISVIFIVEKIYDGLIGYIFDKKCLKQIDRWYKICYYV